MWLVIDIGCIECDEDSNVVGLYRVKARADRVAERLNDVLDFPGGQHAYAVFPLPAPDETAEPYREHLTPMGMRHGH